MRISSTVLLALGSLMGLSSALDHSLLRHYDRMSRQGMLPDGTPMQQRDQNGQLVERGVFTDTTNFVPDKVLSTEYIELPLDHFGGDPGTFKNRFWVNDAGYVKGKPIFIYDGGEGGLSTDDATYTLQNPQSTFKQLVDKFQGMGILWEHRYYGESTPVTISVNTSAVAMKYLTAQQAMADVPALAWNFSRPSLPGVDLTPSGAPWVFVGGSYPGMRAAFIRNTYPDTIFASYASSAPVEAHVDMSCYFEPIWQGLNHYGFGNCSQDIKAAVQYIDGALVDDQSAKDMKIKFLGQGAEINSNALFADSLEIMLYGWQSYGVEGQGTTLRTFCDYISTDPDTQETSSADGWAASKGAEWVVDRWAANPNWVGFVNQNFNVNCKGPATAAKNATAEALPLNCDLSGKATAADSISWMWQYCTQWGFLQAANPGDHQLVSNWTNLQHQMDFCTAQFEDGQSSGLMPDWPRVDETNKALGGWDIRPSNTFWSGGQFDPWRTLSPLSDMSFSENATPSNKVPSCVAPGETKTEDYLFGALIPDAEHCFDFNARFSPASQARTMFHDALQEWLGCWTPGTKRSVSADPGNGDDGDDGDDNDDDDDEADNATVPVKRFAKRNFSRMFREAFS
jgi:hypothetical protein